MESYNKNLISNGPPRINYNNINLDKKKNFISEGRPIDPNNVFKTNNQNTRRTSTIPVQTIKVERPIIKERQNSINKSINKTKIKESKTKKTVRIIAKATLIASILAVLVTGGYKLSNEISTHTEGEKIKQEIVINFEDQLKSFGINKEHLDQFIDTFDKDFLEDNLFEIYLITNNDGNIMNKVSKKLYNKSFSSHIKESGYFEQEYGNDGKPNSIRYASYRKWENAMEAKALKEKKEKELKQQETQQFEDFQNYSKGAR